MVNRNSAVEKQRIADLMRLLPSSIDTVVDIGARDGFISKLLAERFLKVTALDLEKPSIDHRRIHCVQGDVTGLDFQDATFDLVFCTEVLEHISTPLFVKACDELSRVSSRYLLIGVPYKQDIRVERTTCRACGKKNPPWGHVNSFDESKLRRLFPAFEIVNVSFVGMGRRRTNFLSCILMDMAGNPYGTYCLSALRCEAIKPAEKKPNTENADKGSHLRRRCSETISQANSELDSYGVQEKKQLKWGAPERFSKFSAQTLKSPRKFREGYDNEVRPSKPLLCAQTAKAPAIAKLNAGEAVFRAVDQCQFISTERLTDRGGGAHS
jgi:hypothetical protein